MNNKNLTDMSREEKEKYAEERMKEMKLKNMELQRRFAEVTTDRMAAENNNSSITNSVKALKQEDNKQSIISTSEELKVKKYGSITTRSTREWDRDKFDDKNWETHKHTGFKNYKEYYDKKNYKSYERSSHVNDRYTVPHFRDNTVRKNKESRYHCSESSKKSHNEKNKRTSESKKITSKYESSSSSEDDYKYKKINKHRSSASNKEKKSSFWHSDRVNEDRDKQNRTHVWVQSLQEPSLEQETIKNVNRKSYSKFERFEHSNSDSTDSESENISKNESLKLSINEKNTQIEEIKLKKNDKEEIKLKKNDKEEIKLKKTATGQVKIKKNSFFQLKNDVESPNLDSKNIREEKKSLISNKKCTQSNTKLSAYYAGIHSVKKDSDNLTSNLARNVSSSDVESSLLKKSTHNGKNNNSINTEKCLKKGTKRDPENNSPDRFKNQSKQRKFFGNKMENNSQYNVDYKLKKLEQCYSKTKKAGVDDSLNQVSDDGIWESVQISGKNWKDSKEKVISQTKEIDTHFKVKSPTASDDGAWSTVEEGDTIEEGEIVSDDCRNELSK